MDDLIENGPKKLYKSRTEKVLFGVCGGIAEYYFIDPTWVRLVFVFLAIAGGSGFLIYLILALIMPSMAEPIEGAEPAKVLVEKKESKKKDTKEAEKRRTVLGLVVVLIGILAFFKAVFPIYWIDWDILWPIIIILIGFSIIVRKGE